MKHLLVPTDFSNASNSAARYAVCLAAEYGADVTLLNVTPPSVLVHDSMFASVMITQAEILQQNRNLMDLEIASIAKVHHTNIKGRVVEGYFSEAIPEIARQNKSDLVVMGMKGKGKSNSVFGSTTTAIIRRADFPVLVIPEKAEFTSLENITFASDFTSELDLNGFSALFKLAEKFNAPVDILNIEKKGSGLNSKKAMGKMNTSVLFSKINHQFHTIEDSNVEKGIHKFLEAKPSGLLAMVASRHNLFDRLFGKVHTREMSYQTKIPLLVLKEKQT